MPPPVTDADGNVQVDVETVINPKVAELGKPVWSIEDDPDRRARYARAHGGRRQIAEGRDRADAARSARSSRRPTG